MPALPRPSPAELEAARAKTVPDLIGPGLLVLLVGINPSLWSAAIGHHFGNPANRLWPALHAAGVTPRRLLPTEGAELLALGYGITNLVDRATARAAEVRAEELRAGAAELKEKVARNQPRAVAFLGMTAYRSAYDRPDAGVGLQEETVAARPVWVLPNPSGLNAHYQLPDLARLYGELHAWAQRAQRARAPGHERTVGNEP